MSETDPREEVVFEAALQLPARERAAYLDRTCAGDAVLRNRVQGLLGAFDRAGGFLNQPAVSTTAGTMVVSLPPAEKPGDRIGRYKLLERIGEGGCGVVYMAEQEEPVRRRVALKLIKPGMDTQSVIARFEAERQALAMMDHPNIARVFDGGVTGERSEVGSQMSDVSTPDLRPPTSDFRPLTSDSGRPFFVMELVRGIRITDYCQEHGLTTRQRLDLFTAVCSAVQHAHQKGIIHRDLKPSNILVAELDGRPVPKVIDFGIAKATEQKLTDKTLFTQFAQFVGTPAYMSPEQAAMSGADIDTRADIYSLGVLLYELLTGTTPFDAQDLLQAGFDEMRRIIRETEPPKPSTRLTQTSLVASPSQPATRHSSLATDLDWIVMKALEKDRARRYETASGLAADIQRHLNNEPVTARPAGAGYRFRKMVRRNKLAFAAAAAVLSTVLIGLGVSTWLFVKEREARERAVAAEKEQSEERKKAGNEAGKSTQVAEFLQDMLKGVGPSVALGRDTTLLREILDRTADRIGRDLKDRPEVEAELRHTLAGVYQELGDSKKAIAMYRGALATARKLWGDEHEHVAVALSNLSLSLGADGQLTEAESTQREALAIQRKLRGSEHAAVAKVLDNLGGMLWLQGRLAEAEALHREALAMRRKLLGSEHENVAASLNNLAGALAQQGKPSEAEPLYREALAMLRKLLEPGHPRVAGTLNNLAGALKDQNKLDEAESLHREALTMQRKLYGNEHRHVATSLNNLALVLEKQGGLVEAESLYREVLAMQRKLLGDEHPDIGNTFVKLAKALNDQNKLDEFESLVREELEIVRKLTVKDPPRLEATLADLGVHLLSRQKYADAEPLLLEANELRQQNKAADRKSKRDSLTRLIRLYEAWEKPDPATEWRQKLEVFDKAETENATGTEATPPKP